LAFLVGTAGYYFGIRNQQKGVYSEIISAEKQVVNEYILPDGSIVALNSNSKLEFPKKFKNNIREVTITGEAFFDVIPNSEKPFIMETGKVQVVCNEKLNTLKAGEILLNPGEKGILLNSLGKLEKTVNTDTNYLAWKTHNLIFDNTPLNEVVHYLNRTYHAEIQLRGENLENLSLTAQFERKPIDFILNVIQLTFGLKLEQENDIYILTENETLNK